MAEKLKTKETPETLFVGVGGIGSDIVSSVAGMCKDNELNNARFVVMDTDANWLKSIKQGKAVITKVQTSSSLTVKEYLEKDDDARLNWFPNNSTMYGKTVSEGAGQVRAISRLALNNTIRTGEISKLYKEIENLLLKDSDIFKQALRVVIVSSATGGTGSGMAMITAMLIREYLHENYPEKKAIIRGFFVLPSVLGREINSQIEKNSQYRNGYATIKEINAFMMIASGYGGTEDSLKRYKDLHVAVPVSSGGSKKLSCLPFDFCFLMESADTNAENLDSIDAYKDLAAQCIYEQTIGPMQEKAFALEDNIIKEFSQKDKFARNRFGGIGVSKIIYPYEDIADYVAYSRAIQRIGGEGASGSWSSYDKAYEADYKNYAKKRSMTDDKEPELSTSYIAALERDNSLFGKDLKDDICGSEDVSIEVDDMLGEFIDSLEEYIKNAYTIKENDNYNRVKNFEEKNYKPEEIDEVDPNRQLCNTFEVIVKSDTYRFAKNLAKSLFYSAPGIGTTDVNDYHIEKLLQKNKGAVHPNSARYILYKLTSVVNEKYEDVKEKRKTVKKEVSVFSDGHLEKDGSKLFNVNENNNKSLKQLIDFTLNAKKKSDDFEVGLKKINDKMKEYAAKLNSLMEYSLYEATYEILKDYLISLNKTYERFYSSFASKVVSLNRKKDEIVDALKEEKGSNKQYLCSSEDKLNEITKRVAEAEKGFLLPAELSAEIFETVKKNAALIRLREYDKYAEGTIIDIFDTVLIEYFRNQVREDGKDRIDLNVIQAIFFDKELEADLEKMEDDKYDGFSVTKLTDLDRENAFNQAITDGKKLSAPSICGQVFVEPRDIRICTFSEELLDMRDIKVKRFIEGREYKTVPSNTVSKYELRFFTAMYNITPDTIPLFRGPQHDKVTGGVNEYDTGIYYKAYHEYGKLIGPDSMKSSTISTHIDKRWDAVVELPELDFDVLYDEIRRAHVSLICGLLMGNIRKFPSTRYDEKRVFMIINEDGDHIPLIVSNGTECDEFYEVLDALYRDKEHANLLIDAADEYTKVDIEKNNDYSESSFVKFLNTFRIPGSHNNPTSLFEIPLMYYNSLPNALKDNHELSVMIDAVIYLLESVVKKLEREQDQSAYLCKLLEDQFELFVASFNNDEYDDKFGIRKKTKIYDNIVISMVSQKIIKMLKKVDVSGCAERVEKIRNVTREPDYLYEGESEAPEAESAAVTSDKNA